MTLPKPTLIQADETSIFIEWETDLNLDSYQLDWKEYPQPWETADSRNVSTRGDCKIIQQELHGLNPGTTYCIRLSSYQGEIGPELIVDTNAISCTPEKKSCCVIL